jgi:hypothetical protein
MGIFQHTNIAQAASTSQSTSAAAASIGLMGQSEEGQSGQSECYTFWPQMLQPAYVSTNLQKAGDPYFAKVADLYRLEIVLPCNMMVRLGSTRQALQQLCVTPALK